MRRTLLPPLDSADRFIIAAVAATLLLAIGGGAALAKLFWPALVTLAALYWSARSPGHYVRLLLWAFILSPGLRHFDDWYAGFSQVNPIMLAPYLAVFAATGPVLRTLINGQRHTLELLILILAVVFGTGLSLATGDVKDPLMAAMRWLAPLWVALYVVANADMLPVLRAAVRRTFVVAIPLAALYGIDQFVAIQPWDAYFMKEAPIGSIGFPVPFQVRVFATMNSPGSLAAMLSTGLLLLLPEVRGLIWILGLLALSLTTQRAAIGGLTVAVLTVAFATTDRLLRRGLARVLLCLVLAGAIIAVVPGADKKVISTLSSVSHLQSDNSAQERWSQYEDVMPLLDGQKFGRGLAWSSNPFYINVGKSVALDSGLIDIFVSLGVVGGFVFLFAMLSLVVKAWRVARSCGDGAAYGEFACVIFGVAQLPFADQQTSEHGVFLYLALGLLLARPLTLAHFIAAPRRQMAASTRLL